MRAGSLVLTRLAIAALARVRHVVVGRRVGWTRITRYVLVCPDGTERAGSFTVREHAIATAQDLGCVVVEKTFAEIGSVVVWPFQGEPRG